MPELIDEPNSEPFNLSRALDIVRRRHFHFIIPLFAGWLLVWGSSWLMAPRYKSSTLILVQEPTMPADYVQPNVSGDLQDRLQSITQQILSRTRLLLIVDKMHLYQGKESQISDDDRVERMRKDINIDLVRDSRNNEISAFRVSFQAHDPQVAKQVTTELTDLFISENQRVRQNQSEDTTKFIEGQLENARVQLAAQEARVQSFQAQHQGDLPSQQASNLQILSGLQSQLQNEQDSLNTAKQQRVYLQALIEQNHPSRAVQRNTDPAVVALDQKLSLLRSQLTELSSRYTENYPDVQRLKGQIANTEKQRSDLIAQLKANPGRQVDDAAGSSANPALLQLQGQLDANQLEISNREHAIVDLKGRINEYQGRLNGTPGTEQQLAELTRGYDQSKADYDSLLKKKNESAMATSMEQMLQGERFSILDPPTLPIKPDFPNRLKFFGFGLVFGLALGALVAGIFEWLDDRLYDDSEIKAILPMTVISEIPQVATPLDAKRNTRKTALKWVVTGTALVIMVAGAAVSYLHA